MENDFSFQQIRILATTLVVLIPRSHPDQGAPHQVKREIKSFPVPIVLTSALATGNQFIIIRGSKGIKVQNPQL